ncbi:hypothetical protein ABZ845_31435 [Streptomyces sp. NPDC047022]|uniref:hypothetical protein n=1 Tax=Streptomyces sp. NPDC047022 TaxID=3155737 RepID=UPI0033C8A31B
MAEIDAVLLVLKLKADTVNVFGGAAAFSIVVTTIRPELVEYPPPERMVPAGHVTEALPPV